LLEEEGLRLRSATELSRSATAPTQLSTDSSLPERSRREHAPQETAHNLSAIADAFADEIEIVPEPPEEHGGVFIGMKVRHGKFGVGTVRKVEGEGEGQKVIVWFNSVGPKKLMLRFAGLERA
jgi:DNA helicase-2/ATP-dependent DNA helicase PcrA